MSREGQGWETRENHLQQSFVFLLLVRPEGDAVYVFRLSRELKIDEFEVFLAPQTKILHERLQEGLGTGVTTGQRPSNDCIEHVRLFEAASKSKKSQKRVEVPDIVDAAASRSAQFTNTG